MVLENVLISLRRYGSTDTNLSLSCRGGRCWLFDGDWIGRWKRILERIVQRLFLVLTRAAHTIIIALARFAFRIGIHFYIPERAVPTAGPTNLCLCTTQN